MRNSARRLKVAPSLSVVALTLVFAATLFHASTSLAGWVLPDLQIGRNTVPLLLLSRPEVQADLKLSVEASAELDRVIYEIYAKAQSVKGRRDPEAVAARRGVDEAQRVWLERNLTDVQRARLSQLALQWEGPAALQSRTLVADALSLSPDQRRKLATAVADRESKRSIAGRESRADDTALAETVLSLLNDEQQTRWKAMLGPACHFRLATNPPKAGAGESKSR